MSYGNAIMLGLVGKDMLARMYESSVIRNAEMYRRTGNGIFRDHALSDAKKAESLNIELSIEEVRKRMKNLTSHL